MKVVITSDDAKLGQRIRIARRESRVTQEKLADAIGVTFQQVQKYEKGVNRVAMTRLVKIAACLGKPVDWFTSVYGAEDGGSAEDEALISRMLAVSHGVDLARAFLGADAKGRKLLVDMAQSLSKSDATSH